MVLLSHLVPFSIGLCYYWKSVQKWFALIVIDITVFRLVMCFAFCQYFYNYSSKFYKKSTGKYSSYRKKTLAFVKTMLFLLCSLLSHKEFRFILPIVPMAMLICGKGMHHMATSSFSTNIKKHEDENNSNKNHYLSFKGKSLVFFLILTNVPIALYTGLIHQRGTLDVMRALDAKITATSNSSTLFLMPCHSTPYYR